MKKIVVIAILFFFVSLFIIDNKQKEQKNITYKAKVDTIETTKVKKEEDEKRALFISYIELNRYISNKDNKTSKKNIDTMIRNMKDLNFNMMILQVRSFSDAIYKSDIYPWSKTVSTKEAVDPGYDVLEYFIKQAHKEGIEVHAWINPFRIRTSLKKDDISIENPAYSMLGTNDVQESEVGIYYNPASEKVQKLILDGIEELINNYDVDGIHFDDYFYPSNDIDEVNYKEYVKTHENVSQEDYHLLVVNNLIKKVYKTVKQKDKNLEFGISPEGNINNNYTKNYADIYTWASEKGYVDYLMPQIYYGFYNEAKPYMETITAWNDLVTNKDVELYLALAFYKVGTTDDYAKAGKDEWVENTDMIKKQIILARNLSNYQGFSLFRYDNLFNEELKTETTMKELSNLEQIIK